MQIREVGNRQSFISLMLYHNMQSKFLVGQFLYISIALVNGNQICGQYLHTSTLLHGTDQLY